MNVDITVYKFTLQNASSHEISRCLGNASEIAAANATKQNGRFKYAMAVLEGQREDRTLPLRPREMQVIDIPPEVLQPLSWM